MANSDVYPGRFFHPWQVWPGSYDNPFDAGRYPCAAVAGLSISPDTPIASIGSCFSREIKEILLADGYNFLVEESEKAAARHSSAAWERVYSTFSLRQIFEYTFADWQPALRWWKTPATGRIQDPYRRIVLYNTEEEARKDFAAHRICSRRIIEQAAVLILTLEMTEIWEDMTDGSVISLPAGPYVAEGGDMSRYRFRVSRYKENLSNMERIMEFMNRYNPDCRIILMVSPVHLWTTFREDEDVITAGCNSKSTLRAVADECAALYKNVLYFPAYEIATTYRTILQKAVFQEGRENFHVHEDNIRNIMKQFYRFYSHEK
jgi:hypothetical protein